MSSAGGSSNTASQAVSAAASTTSPRSSTRPPPPPSPSPAPTPSPRSTPPAPSSTPPAPVPSTRPTSAPVVVSTPVSSLTPTWITVISTASPVAQLPTTQQQNYPQFSLRPTSTYSGFFPAGTDDANDNATASPFFKNKGAVAATFIVVGLVGAAILSTLVMFCIRKRREKQFERDVALTTAHAERTTRPPPSDYDDDSDIGRVPPMRNASTGGATHRNMAYLGAHGAVTAAAGIPYGKGARYLGAGGMGGYGATATGGVASTVAPSYHTRPGDEDYYNAAPYNNSRNQGGGGYSQTQAAYSSSHGHDAYANYYNSNTNAGASGGQYARSYDNHDAGPSQGQVYGQAYGDPYAAYGGGAQIQPQQRQYQTAGAYPSVGPPNISSRSPPQSPPNRTRVPVRNPSMSGAVNTARPMTAASQGNAGVGRTLMDDASTVRSWYSDDSGAKAAAAIAPKRSLRIANE